MSKKKHYEYTETREYDYSERERAKSRKLQPNNRWRYNPKDVFDNEEENYEDDEY